MFGQSITFNVMLGTALLGATAGAIGTFAVLRKRALVGDMLSHAALPGICIAFVIMQNRNLLGLSLGALATGLLAVGAVTRAKKASSPAVSACPFRSATSMLARAGSPTRAATSARFVPDTMAGY